MSRITDGKEVVWTTSASVAKAHTDMLRASCYLLFFDVFKKIRDGSIQQTS